MFPKEGKDHTVLDFQNQSSQHGTSFTGPLIVDVPDEEIFDKVMKIPLKDVMDARHLTVAIHNNYDVFLTRDCNTILKKRKDISDRFPDIKVMKPSELLTELRKPDL